MNKGDKCKLINEERLNSVSLYGDEGKIVTLDKPLSNYEITDRCKLKGESAWWVHGPHHEAWYVPVSCLQPATVASFVHGQRVELIYPDRLRKQSIPERCCGLHGTIISSLSRSGSYEVRVDGEGYWFITPDCLQAVPNNQEQKQSTSPATEYGKGATTTITNLKQKEIENMYSYKVRFTQVPNALAQQGGEKETIVAVSNNVLASHEYNAVAEAAADNAEAIIKVRESKGTLQVVVKQD